MKKTILQKTVEAIDFPRMRCSDFWEVCPYKIDELKTTSRKQQLTVWRNLGMLFYSHHYQSVVAGSAVFNRDHATCFHGLNRLLALNITDTLQLEAVEKIRKHIKEKIKTVGCMARCQRNII